MSENFLLMNKNTIVMKINFNEGIYDVLDEKLIPFQLKGKIRPVKQIESNMTKYDLSQIFIAAQKNYSAITGFLSSRVLPLTRENAKKIYNLFGFSQAQDEISKCKIAILCRAVSLQDNYWVKLENDKTEWKDVDLRTNHLNEIVAQVSLHGSSLTLQGKETTPELNGQGAYAKAWKRENGKLYLHKVGSNGKDDESRIEVMVSHILDNCNVNHLKYEAAESNGRYTCKCECMTTDNLSILTGMDFISYCNVNGLNPDKEIMKIDSESIYKMWIVDYLTSNSDRHGMNWGFYYNADTMEILGCHPLFDHNNAFDKELMKNKNADYVYDKRMTMRQAAMLAMGKVDFHFFKPFTKKDFLTNEQYNSFMEKARELKIEIINDKDQFLNKDNYNQYDIEL